MPTSGIYTYNLTAESIVNSIARKLGISTKNEPLDAADFDTILEAVNVMIQSWKSDNIQLWLYKDVTLFPQYGQYSYNLGATSTDHATTNYNQTTLATSASSGASTLDLSSVTGFADNYYVGVVLDNGYIFWTQQNGAASGNVITLDNTLTSAASAGNNVYVYAQKAQRPQKIHYATRIEDNLGNETPVVTMPRMDYKLLTNKSATGDIIQIYYDPQLTLGKLWTYQTPDEVTKLLKMQVTYPFQILDSSVDEPDLPPEWLKAIIYNGARDCLTEFGISDQVKVSEIVTQAELSKAALLTYDQEFESIYITQA